ncbi:MAG: hypothetical protein DMF20_11285 [Verrucomicrobia bacterium]|nr:MAG: hypothetical protein DMF20_11285 [Verrucomicrobiota bacterium]
MRTACLPCAGVLASLLLRANAYDLLDLEIVRHFNPMGLKGINRFHKRRSSVAFKPRRRTPKRCEDASHSQSAAREI